LDVLDDSGRDDVLITEVGLVHPDAGLTLIEASVVVAGSDLVGVRAGYPPAVAALPAGVQWEDAQLAPRALVAPHAATPEAFNLVVGLELGESVTMAKTNGFEVKYESGGRDYVYVTPNSVELNEEGCGGAPLS
jgi:hypothetical protein